MGAGKRMQFSTRFLDPADRGQLSRVFVEMQEYYAVFCPPEEVILQDLDNLPVGVEFLVADADRLAGFAAFSTIYPGPGLASGLFLKELFVSEGFRGAGIGRILMRRLANIAIERGHRRIDWTADVENSRLLQFYDALGAARKQEKLFYRLDGDAPKGLGTPQE